MRTTSMNTTNNDADIPGEEVGYGRPPKNRRWKKGQSGNRKGRPKRAQHYRLGDAVAAKLEQEVKVNGGRGEKKLSTLRLLVRRIVEKAATGDMRAVATIVKISEMGANPPPPNHSDWTILTYEEGMSAGRDRLTEQFFLDQERKVAQWRAELKKGGKSPQQALQVELMRRVPATKSGKAVKVPIIEVIAACLLQEASTNVQAFKLLLQILPQKKYKPNWHRVEILRPTQREVEWWGATAKPRTGS